MPGLVPGIHVLIAAERKAWMAGTSPAMTSVNHFFKNAFEACAGTNSFRAAALPFNLERRRACPLDLTIWSTM
jgi:hypothetical protein